MARHTIQLPIIKSACSPVNYRDEVYGNFTPDPVGDILYMQTIYVSGEKYSRTMGFGWELPVELAQKEIVSTELHLYSLKDFDESMGYRFADFTEGGTIPGVIDNTDGVLSSGFEQGWNSFLLPGGVHESVVIGQLSAFYYGDYHVSEVYSNRNASNQPYVIVTYDDIPPDPPSGLYPSGGSINPREDIRFSWAHNSPEGLGQTGFVLEYSTNGGSTWTTISQTTTNQYYDMAANTLPTSGTVVWRVKTIDTNAAESDYASASFSLELVPQQAPRLLTPRGQYINRADVTRFEWIFSGGASGETQSSYELQYSTDNGDTWTTLSETTTNEFREVPAFTFPLGTVLWKVRTYNNWSEVSPYSEEASFTVIGVPGAPQINSVTDSGKPVISWSATQQSVVEIQILKEGQIIYDTGPVPTLEKTHKVSEFLEDGEYKIRIRVANEFSLYSAWSEYSLNLVTTKPTVPEISVFSGTYSVAIVSSSTADTVLVYRDGQEVGELENGVYNDYTGANKKEYEYMVRAVDINDNFADSTIATGKASFNGNTIAAYSSPEDYLRLLYGYSNPISKSKTYSQGGALLALDGRAYPVVEFTPFKGQQMNLTCFFENVDELDELIDLLHVKEPLIFRDNDGSVIVGAVFNITSNRNQFGYLVSFSLTEVEV